MHLPVNSFKHAIAARKLQLGLWSILFSHVTVKIIAGAGCDWIVLDTEHAANELPMVYAQLQASDAARGYSSAPRANRFGRAKDNATHCEDELCVLLQVETRRGLDNLEAIAGVEGVFIGPGDLAAALGHVGDAKHPDVLRTIEATIARIHACGKPAGILTPDETLARRCIELGGSFVANGSDQGLMARGAEQLVARLS
ncbi:MAG: 2-dehydro-3-deoxyglucarate aldolase [Hyphomicrobiales bacterium]|nr:2-dehydro-3-deoxyglucarate aldolase [Hyphomicrobiales bacterium]